MKLYYSPGACSLAAHIALEESGLDFTAERLDFGAGEQRGDAYRAINPKGRVPALVDGDLIVTENPAVLRYISRKAPDAALWPDDARGDARCSEWLAWLSSGVHVTIAHVRRTERYATTDSGRADVSETAIRATRAVYADVDARLAERSTEWAAGDRYSVADGYLYTIWTWGRRPELALDMARDCPSWTALADRVLARPATTRALARES